MSFLTKIRQTSVKTKILPFALILIFLPSGILGYLGYRSIEGREIRLRDNYQGLARLLRDQLEGEIRE